MIFNFGAIALISALATTIVSPAQRDLGATQASRSEVPSVNSSEKDKTPPIAMLPSRLLDCTLGRVANFEPNRIQAPSEYVYDGRHKFALFLPPTPVRTSPPPETTAIPEPVDPKTRIMEDPDGLAAEGAGHPFDRVVDYWPERVELTAPVNKEAVTLIIVSGFDASKGTADFFMTKANDAATYDLQHLYAGTCKVDMSGRHLAAKD